MAGGEGTCQALLRARYKDRKLLLESWPMSQSTPIIIPVSLYISWGIHIALFVLSSNVCQALLSA